VPSRKSTVSGYRIGEILLDSAYASRRMSRMSAKPLDSAQASGDRDPDAATHEATGRPGLEPRPLREGPAALAAGELGESALDVRGGVRDLGDDAAPSPDVGPGPGLVERPEGLQADGTAAGGVRGEVASPGAPCAPCSDDWNPAWIRAERLRQGLTIDEIAKRAWMQNSTVAGVETPGRDSRFTNVIRVLAVLGVTADELRERHCRRDGGVA
jgi:hypothetical protein